MLVGIIVSLAWSWRHVDAGLLNVVLYLPVAGIFAIIALPARADDACGASHWGMTPVRADRAALCRFDPAVDLP